MFCYFYYIVNPGRLPYFESLLYLFAHVQYGQRCGDFLREAANLVKNSRKMSPQAKTEATAAIVKAQKIVKDKGAKKNKSKSNKKYNGVTNALRPYVKVYNLMWAVRQEHLG